MLVGESKKSQRNSQCDEKATTYPVDPEYAAIAEKLNGFCAQGCVGGHDDGIDQDKDQGQLNVLRQHRLRRGEELRQESREKQVTFGICNCDEKTLAKDGRVVS